MPKFALVWKYRVLLVASLFVLPLAPAVAADEISFTVAAGEHDRRSTPVSVPVDLPAGAARDATCIVKSADGQELAGRILPAGLGSERSGERAAEIHFVLPELKAGQSANFTAEIASGGESADKDTFTWRDSPGKHVDLKHGNRAVLRYMYTPLDESSPEARQETFKVYHHVFSPDGKTLLTKGPGGLYPHHRGLFFGFSKVTYGEGTKCDIWHCRGAHQAHKEFEVSQPGPVVSRQLATIDWCGKNKEVFGVEDREITVYDLPGGTLIDFVSKLTPVKGPIKLDGDPQHAGFHFRASQEVAEKTKGQSYYLRHDGKGGEGETRNWDHKSKNPDPKAENLPWNALSMVVGGRRYTVVYMDSPANPKPARYSERDYGRFGSYFVTEVTEEKPLLVKYRVWVQDGEMTIDEAAALDADFDQPPRVCLEGASEGVSHSAADLKTEGNVPPEGFVALFNGKDLTGWKGLVADPVKRAKMSASELAKAQKKADERMRKHWTVEDGVLMYDGKGNSLCTAKDYGDFELLVDWKITEGGDSGIYVRGTPQIQIWDTNHEPIFKHGAQKGSGGLWNNKHHERFPLVHADNPAGQWNTFRIRMVGEKVSVWLNGELVTDNVTMENLWEPGKPIYSTGQIELQHHGSPLEFKNIFIKEL